MSTLYRANVTRVQTDGVMVEIPELGAGAEFGPCSLLDVFELSIGDKVIVGNIEDIHEDFVVFGPLVDVATPPDPPVDLTPHYPAGTEITVGVATGTHALDLALASASDGAIATQVTGDANRRFIVAANGDHSWGNGTAVQDVTMKRINPDGLRIDPRLGINSNPNSVHRLYVVAGGTTETAYFAKGTGTATVPLYQAEANASSVPAYGARVAADSVNRWQTLTTGEMAWGPGSGATDTYLRRESASGMRLNPRLGIGAAPDSSHILYVQSGSASAASFYGRNTQSSTSTPVYLTETPDDGDHGYASLVTGDSSKRFLIHTDGFHRWGSGSASLDTTLYRNGVGILKTDGNLEIVGSVDVGTTLEVFNKDIGRGLWVSVTSTSDSSATSGTTELALLTTASTTFKANRAYRIVWDNRFTNTAGTPAASIPAIIFRKTNTAGQQLTDFGREQLPSGASTYHLHGTAIFTVGGSDVTSTICQTILSNTGTNVTLVQKGSASFPRGFFIYDVGPASDYSSWVVLV